MSDDQLDSAEANLFREIAGNLHHIDKTSGGSEKTGLHSKHTRELIKKLGSSGVQAPRRPSPSIPEIPSIPDSAELKPIDITEDMLKEAQLEDMDAIHNPKVEAPDDIPKELLNEVGQIDRRIQQGEHQLKQQIDEQQPQQDPNQMELGFDVVKAEDVFNEINDLTTQVRLLRQELREIKTCLKQSE